MSSSAFNVLFPHGDRHPYYIFTPPHTRYSAGIKVLHTLCHLLDTHDQLAYVVTSKVSPNLATPILTTDIIQAHFEEKRTPIVVYPERLAGNPLQAPCVVRYLLNVPNIQGVEVKFEPNHPLVW